ncbi:Hypothetical_protein [Hexamita inflata]|uniref:Hypothetical_protein n=1 Tax=Hexamita inflata TaxID=28002 RepID=A0AA86V4C5_9EUKA|nr:Hypothetical protein HINF_LOCUS34399 [Hexamita inflata]CAI9971264.1 Hypothetical protein HINF_LOCUS58909 [Hexamita inflata]CAI9976016.1 Hypothetical protein HINF_LOCUS63661 [Hexamita inflata]
MPKGRSSCLTVEKYNIKVQQDHDFHLIQLKNDQKAQLISETLKKQELYTQKDAAAISMIPLLKFNRKTYNDQNTLAHKILDCRSKSSSLKQRSYSNFKIGNTLHVQHI